MSELPGHPMRVPVEICVEGLHSAVAADQGLPDRIELCDDLPVGGVTPDPWSIRDVCQRVKVPVQVLIRPRAGDFVYDSAELAEMTTSIELAKDSGASGVVLGPLTSAGRVDLDRMARLIKAARPMSVTFHKAFDVVRDPFEALDDLIDLGVDRILTSGQAPTAMDGLDVIVELTKRAWGTLAIMAGGSITLDQIKPMVDAGIREIHLGSAACREGVTDPDLVRQIVRAANPSVIFHIASRFDWGRAQIDRLYGPESLKTEGFIHASTLGQVAGSANRFFRGRMDLVLLMISVGLLKVPVHWVESPDSDKPFPHIHGPIDLDAILEAIPFEPDASGHFTCPPQRWSDP